TRPTTIVVAVVPTTTAVAAVPSTTAASVVEKVMRSISTVVADQPQPLPSLRLFTTTPPLDTTTQSVAAFVDLR
ncbi:hypothetical protein Tco_1564556, partial [Tanacetum coccineum]